MIDRKNKKCQVTNYNNLRTFFYPGVPNLGDARGTDVMISWVQSYQWGDAIDVRGMEKLKGWEPFP